MGEITVAMLGDASDAIRAKIAAELGPDVRLANTGDSAAKNARVLFSWGGGRDDLARAMEGMPQLEWIHSRSAGLDKLLFPALIDSAVVLTNGSGVFSQALGEFAILGALWFAKFVPRLLQAKAERKWEHFNVYAMSKQTMGVVGHGDIGRAVAWRAKALGMRVLALRRDPSPRPGDEHVDQVYATADILEMLPKCDYVAVAAPLTPETQGLMSKREFAAMKREAVIINVGRGPVIDEAAMIDALQTGQIRGAALDVFEVEPLPKESPLWGMDNVLISPHCTDNTMDWLDDAANFFIEQFGRWREGAALKNIVSKRAGY
jgi:phosphoglycerate dehydrogenase-like enzyme